MIINGTVIGENNRPFVIAEVGQAHEVVLVMLLPLLMWPVRVVLMR